MRRRLVADIADADGIELVQGRHRAALVPPLRAEPGELVDLGRIDGRSGIWGLRHS
jgi:hypothetical protein